MNTPCRKWLSIRNESHHSIDIGVDRMLQLKKLNDKAIDQLFEAVLTLKDVEECYVFFDDLCTVNEIQSLSQRLEVARMLRKGSTYNAIEAETGASTATISRVKRCLNYGNDGYKIALGIGPGPLGVCPNQYIDAIASEILL